MTVNGHNIYGAQQACSNPLAVHEIVHDSIAVANSERATVMIAHFIERMTGMLPTRVVTGLGPTLQRFGSSVTSFMLPDTPEIGAQQADPYLTDDGRAPLTNGQGFQIPADGTHAFGITQGDDGSMVGIFADPRETGTSWGAFQGIVPPTITPTRVFVRPFVQAGANGITNRVIAAHDGNRNGAVVKTFNPSTDLRGFRSLAEDFNTLRGSAVPGMIHSLEGWEVTNQTGGSNPSIRTFLADQLSFSQSDNTAIADGTNLTFTGVEYSKLDLATGLWVPGPTLRHTGGNSWNSDGIAFDVAPDAAMPKTFTDDQWTYRTDAMTWDTSHPTVYWVVLAVEAGADRAEIETRMARFMSRTLASDTLIGKQPGHYIFGAWFLGTNVSAQDYANFYGGMEDAAKSPPGGCTATSIDGASAFDGVAMNGSAAAIAKVAEKGRTVVSFGPLVGQDVSDGDYLDGLGVHQKDIPGNVALLSPSFEAIENATAPPASGGGGSRSHFTKGLVDRRLVA